MTRSTTDLVVHGLCSAGGGTRRVHTEEIARRCWELFPDVFSWSRYPQYPDRETVRAALADASTLDLDARVSSPEPDIWILTSHGIAWAVDHAAWLDRDQARRAKKTNRRRQRRVCWAAVLIGSVASLAVSYGVAHLAVLVGSVDGHWIYQYVEPFQIRSLAVGLAAGAAAVALLAVPDTFVRRRAWCLVIVWLAAAFALQALLRTVTPVTFESIFVSDTANSYYGAARQYTAATILSDFEHLRLTLPLHAQSNMPGKLMLVHALKLISRRPAVLAWLVVAVSNLGGVLMYLFVRDLFNDRRVALFALVLYLFVPAKLYFFPLLDTVTPVVALAGAYLSFRWLHTRRTIYAALLGVAVYALIFFDPLVLIVGLLPAALAARATARGEIAPRTFLVQCSIAVAAFAAVYVVMIAAWHFDLFATLLRRAADAVSFNARYDRPYSIWVWQNLLDFAFGLGVGQTVVFCAVLGVSLSGPEAWRARLVQPIAIVCATLAGTLLILDLIGAARGEVIRIWIFLACFFQIPTAYACARSRGRTAMALVVIATLVQSALGTAMIGFVLP